MAKQNKLDKNDPKLIKLLKEYDAAASDRSDAEKLAAEAADKLSVISKQLIEYSGGGPITRKSGARMVPMIRPSEKEAKKLREEGKEVPPTRWFYRLEGAGGLEAGV